jgi:hypothetical protein
MVMMSDQQPLWDEINQATMEHFHKNWRTIRNRVYGFPRIFKIKDQWYFAPSWPWTMPWAIRKAGSWTDAVRLAAEHKSGWL